MLQQFLSGVSSGLLTAAIIALASTGFSLQFGITNFLNVAYGDYLTLGAFLWYSFAVAVRLGTVAGLVIAVLLTAVFAVLVNLAIFRPIARRHRRPFLLMIVSLAVSILIENALLATAGSGYFTVHLGSSQPIVNANGFLLTPNGITIMVVAVAVMLILAWTLQRTRMGRAMRAMSDDRSLAQACGIDTRRIENLTWLVAGVIAAIAGIVLVLTTASFDTTTGNSLLWLIIPAAFVGGIGNPYGAMAGGALVGLVDGIVSGIIGAQFNVEIAAGILFLVLLLRPQGIVAVVRTRIA
jgi:branched-chain amino acid transport system permease protein/neutral amino acid transport system permease protein